jgi:hypothetical protein
MATGIEARFEMGQLMTELRHYLIVVDAFRAEGCGPSWQSEAAPVSPVGPGLEPGERLTQSIEREELK